MINTDPILKGIEVLEYIPQRPPMVMLDSLYRITETSAMSGLSISKENIFLKEGEFSPMGMIENIAQTAAIFAGYHFKQKSVPVKIGFIGNVKNLEINYCPKLGEQIYTQIEEVNEVMNVKIIRGEITCNEKICATCEMKIFLMKEES